MSRWIDKFSVGQRVVTLVQYAEGQRWQSGTVVRKTKSGQPMVSVDRSAVHDTQEYLTCVTRKSEIVDAGEYETQVKISNEIVSELLVEEKISKGEA